MAALLEQGADALAASPAAVDETATWGADPSRVRAVAAERPLDVRIVAGRAEPPITVLPSTLVADLRGLLRFPTAADGGDGGLWPRLFQSVALRVAAAAGAGGEGEGEGEEQEAASSSDAEASYTVWAHRSWIARRCPYFGRALASGAWVGNVIGMEGLQVLGFGRPHACLHYESPHTRPAHRNSLRDARGGGPHHRARGRQPRGTPYPAHLHLHGPCLTWVCCAVRLTSSRSGLLTHHPHRNNRTRSRRPPLGRRGRGAHTTRTRTRTRRSPSSSPCSCWRTAWAWTASWRSARGTSARYGLLAEWRCLVSYVSVL